jgi:hypothetical protein
MRQNEEYLDFLTDRYWVYYILLKDTMKHSFGIHLKKIYLYKFSKYDLNFQLDLDLSNWFSHWRKVNIFLSDSIPE